MRLGRRRYLTSSVAVLGGVLGAACSLTESRWRGTGPSHFRRAAPVTLRVLYGPWAGAMNDAGPVDYGWDPMDDHIRLTGSGSTRPLPPPSWSATRIARSASSPITIRCNRALELHRAGTAPDIFQTDDLRNADLIRRRLAHRLDGWIKHKQLPHADDFVQPALLAGQTAGVQWGLPLFTRVYTLYFNRHILRAARDRSAAHDLG